MSTSCYTEDVSVSLFPVPATNFGTYEVSRVASPAEMAATAGRCANCAVVLVTKLGGRPVPGAMIGRRANRTAAWTWAGPHCHPCDQRLATAAEPESTLVAA